MRILVVDDDRAVRDALRRALTLGGYEVQSVEDGKQALEQVVQAVPDAVVLDVGLPGIDGLEVCRRLRLLGNRVPILILTARDAVADRIDGLDVGADDYMVKPFDVGELKARLRALLRRSGPDSWAGPRITVVCRAAARQLTARSGGAGAVRRVDPDGVSIAGAVDAQPKASATAQLDLRPRVGLRLRPGLERAARVCRVSAPQAGGGGARQLIHTVRGVGYVLREP